MRYMRFLPKTITINSEKEVGFKYKNNHKYNKSANFWLDNISKIDCRILVILLYTLSKLKSKKI